VCRKLSNPWHRNCRAPHLPILYRLFDISIHSNPLNIYYRIKTSQIGENEAIQTLLIKIYGTSFKLSFQGFDIRLQYITTGAMLEMLPWKPVTATSSYCIVQELTEGALEAGPYFMKVPSDPGLQNTKTELDV